MTLRLLTELHLEFLSFKGDCRCSSESTLVKLGYCERVIVDGHGCHTALHFGVKAKENQDKVPTLYWLPKLHKKPF